MNLTYVYSFALEQLEKAKNFSHTIKFAEQRIQKSMTANRSEEIRIDASISDDPEFASLNIGDGVGAWATIAAVDLRGSTRLADTLSPRETYLMAHTLLPTLAHVCEKKGGSVMNFRGDGLFASFGLKKHRVEDVKTDPNRSHIEESNSHAVVCGLALVEATTEAVQPALETENIFVDLQVGVGVDCGHVVVTRVGWMTAQELTAYGSAVNHACKLSTGENKVLLSRNVNEQYPSGEGGTMQLNYTGDGYQAYSPNKMLRR